MNRRHFLAGLGASATAAQASQAAPADAGQPNFLVLMSDQHSPHVAGCFGDPVARTPNLDALAGSGVIFENAYCQSPVCVPARMSFLTGQQPSEIKVWGNGDYLPSDVTTFAHSLGAVGYETALIGRMHFNGVDQWHGFEQRLVGSLSPQYPHIPYPLPPELLVGARGSTRAAVELAGPGRTAYQVYDEDVTASTVQFLRNRARGRSRPFCAVAGFVLPHCPYICSREDWEYYIERVTVPEIPPNYFEQLHPAVKLWRKNRGIEDLGPDVVRRARAGYYGLVTHFDRLLGQVLKALRDTGLDRNTVVIYTTDHGEMAGEHGMWWKSTFYDASASVPLVMSCPALFAGGRRLTQVASHVDVGPTMVELAGSEPMPAATGHSLVPLLKGTKTDWTDEAFSEYPESLGVPPTRMIRSGKWKLIHYEGYRPQLFNLEEDPREWRDLGEHPQYAAVRQNLLERALNGWSAEEMKREQARRARHHRLLGKWAQQVRPNASQQWNPPPDANRFEP